MVLLRQVKRSFGGGDIKWATAKDVANLQGRYLTETERRITEKGVNGSNAKVFPEGTIVITARGTVGKLAILGEPMSFNQTCYGLIPIPAIDKMYVFYALKNGISKIDELSYGTVFQTITMKTFDELEIRAPSLEQQRRESKILSDLDTKIELNQQMNKTLESIAQALFKHWFIDFEFPDENGQPYKSSGGEMVDSELGEIPREWGVEHPKNIGKIVCGKTPSTKISKNFGDDFPFIKIPDMRGMVFTENTEVKLSQSGSESLPNRKLPPMTVCVSCIATPGLVTITSVESYTNQQINSIICKDKISPFYVYLQMKTKKDEIFAKGSSGTSTLNLNTGEFSKIKILMPSPGVMDDFHKALRPMFKRILYNQKESDTLTRIRDQLLPKLMSGKIRVPLEE